MTLRRQKYYKSLFSYKTMTHLTYKVNSWRLLTHWGQLTHICVSKLNSIGSGNGLVPGRRQTIMWTNDGILPRKIGLWDIEQIHRLSKHNRNAGLLKPSSSFQSHLARGMATWDELNMDGKMLWHLTSTGGYPGAGEHCNIMREMYIFLSTYGVVYSPFII